MCGASVALYNAAACTLLHLCCHLRAISSHACTNLNTLRFAGFLSMRTFVCKFIGVITCIAAGLVSSKGGPLIHLGSIVGGGLSGMGSNTLSQIFKRPIKASRKYGGYFRNDAEHRDYVSIGAAAGNLSLVTM